MPNDYQSAIQYASNSHGVLIYFSNWFQWEWCIMRIKYAMWYPLILNFRSIDRHFIDILSIFIEFYSKTKSVFIPLVFAYMWFDDIFIRSFWVKYKLNLEFQKQCFCSQSNMFDLCVCVLRTPFEKIVNEMTSKLASQPALHIFEKSISTAHHYSLIKHH